MLETSVLGRAYDIWLQSSVFALLQAIFRVFSRSFRNSAIVRFFVKDSRIEPVFRESLFAKLFKWIFDLVYCVLSKICGWVATAAKGGVAARLAGRYVKTSFFLSFETLLGGFICLMFIIPHDYWSNTYALLGVVGLVGLFFVMVGAKTRRPYYIHDMGLPVFLFALACGLGVFASFDRSDSFRVFLFYVTGLLLLYIISADITTRERMMRLLGFIYLAVLISSLFAVYQRFVGVSVSASLTDLSVNKGVPGRVYGSLGNPNNYAEFLAMMTPLAAVFAANVKNRLLRIPLCGAIAVPFLALVMTYSRSSWIAILAACVIFVYYANKKLIPAFFFLFLALIPILIPLLPSSVMVRVASIFNSEDTSGMFRLYIWSGTVDMVRDYLVTGIGLGPAAFAEIYPDYAHPLAQVGAPHSHMVYMELIIEMGLMGFVSFMWYMLRLWKDSARGAYNSASPLARFVLCACVASLVGIAITFAVEYVWYYPRTMFAYFILAGVATAAIRISKNPEKTPNEP